LRSSVRADVAPGFVANLRPLLNWVNDWLTHRLSIYDAAYLELAHRRKLVLSCNDAHLRKARRCEL